MQLQYGGSVGTLQNAPRKLIFQGFTKNVAPFKSRGYESGPDIAPFNWVSMRAGFLRGTLAGIRKKPHTRLSKSQHPLPTHRRLQPGNLPLDLRP